MKLLGIHGTNTEAAQKIKEEGFVSSTEGRVGPGVYFWRYFKDPDYVRSLAIAWANLKSGHGGTKRLSYLTVEITIAEENILDISHGFNKERIRGLVANEVAKVLKELSHDTHYTSLSTQDKKHYRYRLLDEKIHNLYAFYIENFVRPIDIIIADIPIFVGLFQKMQGYPVDFGKRYFASSECFIVLPHKVANIEILECLEVERK